MRTAAAHADALQYRRTSGAGLSMSAEDPQLLLKAPGLTIS